MYLIHCSKAQCTKINLFQALCRYGWLKKGSGWRAGSGRERGFHSLIPLAADPACHPLAFSIVLSDLEPGTGYTEINHRFKVMFVFSNYQNTLSGLHMANLSWQTRVGKPKLECVNGTKTGGKHVCKLLASNRNVFADCFYAVHTHQLEFANTSLPT